MKGPARGPFTHCIAIEQDKIGRLAAGHADKETGGIRGLIARRGRALAVEHAIDRMTRIFLMQLTALGFKSAKGIIHHRVVRSRVAGVIDFDNARLVRRNRASGVEPPKKCGERERQRGRFSTLSSGALSFAATAQERARNFPTKCEAVAATPRLRSRCRGSYRCAEKACLERVATSGTLRSAKAVTEARDLRMHGVTQHL